MYTQKQYIHTNKLTKKDEKLRKSGTKMPSDRESSFNSSTEARAIKTPEAGGSNLTKTGRKRKRYILISIVCHCSGMNIS